MGGGGEEGEGKRTRHLESLAIREQWKLRPRPCPHCCRDGFSGGGNPTQGYHQLRGSVSVARRVFSTSLGEEEDEGIKRERDQIDVSVIGRKEGNPYGGDWHGI